jgi:hypothetical protein
MPTCQPNGVIDTTAPHARHSPPVKRHRPSLPCQPHLSELLPQGSVWLRVKEGWDGVIQDILHEFIHHGV